MPTGDNGRKPDWGIGEVTFLQEGGLRTKIWEINGRNISRLGEACKSTDPRSSASAKRRKLYQDASSPWSEPVTEKAFEAPQRRRHTTEERRPEPAPSSWGEGRTAVGDASQALTCQAGWEPERLRQRQVRGRRRASGCTPRSPGPSVETGWWEAGARTQSGKAARWQWPSAACAGALPRHVGLVRRWPVVRIEFHGTCR